MYYAKFMVYRYIFDWIIYLCMFSYLLSIYLLSLYFVHEISSYI